MDKFITIPLSIAFEQSPVIEREEGTLEQSIDNILDMIVFTPKGLSGADPEFGFEYWNHEFSNIDLREFNNNYLGVMSGTTVLNDISRKQCEKSLCDSIAVYEPRLRQPDVKINLEAGNRGRHGNKQSKYEMHISITGAIDEGLGISRPFEKKISFMVEPTASKIKR